MTKKLDQGTRNIEQEMNECHNFNDFLPLSFLEKPVRSLRICEKRQRQEQREEEEEREKRKERREKEEKQTVTAVTMTRS